MTDTANGCVQIVESTKRKNILILMLLTTQLQLFVVCVQFQLYYLICCFWNDRTRLFSPDLRKSRYLSIRSTRV